MFVLQSRWGLQGHYYPNPQWEGEPAVSRRNQGPHLKDKEGDDLLSTDDYSVKWGGWIAINRSGTYRFATNSDDGSSLRINGETIVDNGGTHGIRKVSQEIDLKKGVYPIEVLYFQAGGHSVMQTLWTTPKESEHLIPAKVLFSKHPGEANILFRKGVILLSGILKVIWGILCVFISLIVVIKSLTSKPAAQLPRRIKEFSSNNRIPLGLAGFFLIGIILTASASKYPLVKQSTGPDWTVHANYNPHETNLAIDRQPETRWSTKQGMKPGMFFQVDMGSPAEIERLTLFHGRSVEDYPQGYRVDASLDGITWKAAQLLDSEKFSERTDIYISPLKTRHIKITQTWYNTQNYWSIHELYLYRPSWLPRSYHYPLMAILIYGLFGSLVFLALSCVSQLQTCGRGTLAMLSLTGTVGLFLRTYLLPYHEINVDESAYLALAQLHEHSDIQWLHYVVTQNIIKTPYLHLLFIRWFFRLFNNSALATRLMSAILGTGTIFLIFFIWRTISSRRESCFEALLAGTMSALFVFHICWSRDGHGVIGTTFLYLLYIFVGCQMFRPHPKGMRVFLGAGLFLFLGFSFHGTMLIAPIGALLFIVIDLLLSTGRLPGWQKFNWKQYLPIVFSALIFAVYVYYLLLVKKGGLGDQTDIKDINVHQDFSTLANFLNFLKIRWQLLIINLKRPWWEEYGIPNYGFYLTMGLAMIGAGDVIRRRQKTEWFLVIQPVLFLLIISTRESVVHLERFFHPLVLPITCLIARGITVISTWFRTTRATIISRYAISILIVLSLGFISLYNIVYEQEIQLQKYSSIVYRVYGGRKGTLFRMLQRVKQSERGANSFVTTNFWVTRDYANTFHINLKFLSPNDLIQHIENDRILPVFVLTEWVQAQNDTLTDALEKRYNVVATSAFFTDSLYELRDDKQPVVEAKLSGNAPVFNPGLRQLRNTPAQLSKRDVVAMIQEQGFSHPDDLSQYGLSEKREGISQHDYELALLRSNAVVIDHAAGLMWQQSGAPEGINLKRARKYINTLNHEQYAGYFDWRLPTVEELASLLEPTKKNGELYIDPVFDPKQQWCWTADHVKNSFNTAWIVHFLHGNVSIRYTGTVFHVRGVRSIR